MRRELAISIMALAVASASFIVAITTPARSATVDPLAPDPFVMVNVDPLADIPNSVFGSECIMPDDLENYWGSQGSGKGLRAPRLCLINPCEMVLSREDLGLFWLGREATFTEWRQYARLVNEECEAGLPFISDQVLLASVFNGTTVPHAKPSLPAVPLPASVWMLASAIGGLGYMAKSRKA